MTILAIETSTQHASVALGPVKGSEPATVFVLSMPEGAAASSQILQAIQDVLRQSGQGMETVRGIAFGAGPGAFTGLRTACSVAQGLAYSLRVPVMPVSSLAAMAWTAYQARCQIPAPCLRICAALDARMGQLYVANYTLAGPAAQEAHESDSLMLTRFLSPRAQLCNLEAFKSNGRIQSAQEDQGAQGAQNLQGTPDPEMSGIDLPVLVSNHPELVERCIHPHATAILALAQMQSSFSEPPWVPAALAQPDYVRNQVALTTAERAATKS